MQEDLTWAICDKVSGENIGAVWLREDHRRRRDKSRCRVLGYLLDKGWWGQGLMTEAVSCVVDYAFKVLISLVFSLPMYGVLLNMLLKRLADKSEMSALQAESAAI